MKWNHRDVIFILFFVLISFIPAVFYPKSYDPFELPKLILIRIGLGLILIITPILKFRIYKNNSSSIFWGLILLISAFSLSTIFSDYRWVSFNGEWERYMGLSSLVPVIGLAFVPMFIDHKKLTLLRYGVFISLVFIIIKSFRQILGYDILPINVTGGRVISSMGNPDFLGQFIVMVIPLLIIETIYSKKIWKILASILFGLTFFVLIASGTRSSWLTFIVLLFLLPVIFLEPKTPIYIYRKTILYVLFFALLIAVNLYLPAGIPIKISVLVLSLLWVYSYLKYIFPYIRESLKLYWKSLVLISIIMITVYIAFPYVELLTPGKNVRLEEMLKNRFTQLSNIKNEGRLYIIKDSFKLIKNEMLNNPLRLFFGFGLDTVGKVFIKYKGLELARKDAIDNITYPDRAHNEYLDTLLQTGLLGLVAFIFILYSVIKKGISIHRTKHPYRIFAGALTLGIIGFATNGVLIFGTSATYLYFYIFCGIIGVINTPKGKRWNLKKDKLYPILISSLIIFCICSTPVGINQIKAHRLLLNGVEAFNNKQLDKAQKLFEASFKAYPIGYTAQRELEIYNIKMNIAKSKEEAKRFFSSGEELFPLILKYVKYPTSSHYAIAAFYMDGYKIDKSYLKDVVFHLKKCLEYDSYYKPALRALANIYSIYLHNPELTYQYSKRYIEIEQRDIFMWKMLMRSARDVKDWETVKFSAEAIYLATEKKDKEAEKFLKEAEKMINLSKNP